MTLIKFSTDIISASASKRELTGVIVPFGKVGHTNMGDVVFNEGSLSIGEGIKLFTEHDMTRPIGKLKSYEETNTGIIGTFKIARTNAGDDALAEAQEGLRTGFSIGATIDDYVTNNENVVVNAATLKEVSHVTFPAFGENAQITEVAASAETSQPQESENTIVSNEVTPEVVEEVAKEVAAPAVEAAERKVMPAIFTAPRSPIVGKASYLEHSIKAALGNEDSRQYVKAADDTTSNNAGLIPTPQLTEVINPLSNANRGTIDAISRGTLPNAGMTFEIPKITAVPTVGATAEGNAPSETGMTNSFVSVSVAKYAGQQTFSWELYDRSSPAFFDELVRQMEFAYASATDSAVATAIVAAATDGGNRTLDASGLLDFVADGAASVYAGSLGFARNLVVSPEFWGSIMGLNDSGRPIYNASQPQNAGGAVSPQSLRGNVAGLDLFVTRSLSGTGDGDAFIINPDAFTWYESPRLQLRTNVIGTGQIEVAYYGYGALANKIAAGAYKWMVA